MIKILARYNICFVMKLSVLYKKFFCQVQSLVDLILFENYLASMVFIKEMLLQISIKQMSKTVMINEQMKI